MDGRSLRRGLLVVSVLVMHCGGEESPTASFTVVPRGGTTETTFQFDASGSIDPEHGSSTLQVRWDWENDGTWDTRPTTAKTAVHQYATVGKKTVRLEVEDPAGHTDQSTNEVEVSTPSPPEPALIGDLAISPANLQIALGQAVSLSMSVVNNGGGSTYGGIGVSFRQLTIPDDTSRVAVNGSGNDSPGWRKFAQGMGINDHNCQAVNAECVLVEYGDAEWRRGERNEYGLTVTPRAIGPFDILVRVVMKADTAGCVFVKTLPSGGVLESDQQGWEAKRFTVTVNPSGSQSGFMLVNAGSFAMGSPSTEPGRATCETAHHVVLTRSFYMCDHEVTQAEWYDIMGTRPSAQLGEYLPVESVSWDDCIAYCNARSIREGLAPAYSRDLSTVTWDQSKNGYRLPTEAEWEYACRAGSESAFCNGGITNPDCAPLDSTLNLVGWYCGNASGPHEVKSKAWNAWQLSDMHGNVWEWCWDRYGPYGGASSDPTGPPSGPFRVIRGGSWYSLALGCRSAMRYSFYPNTRDKSLGFRLSRNAP